MMFEGSGLEAMGYHNMREFSSVAHFEQVNYFCQYFDIVNTHQ